MSVSAAVQAAIEAGDASALRRVLAESPARANELIRWGGDGKNVTHPLHYIRDKRFDKTISEDDALVLIDALIEGGSDVDGHAENRETPLHGAASLGAEDVGMRLIEAGARANALGGFGETPLHWAAHQGLDRLVVRLIAAGADLDIIKDRRWNATPLGWMQHGLAERLPGSGRGHDKVIALLGGS